MIKHLRLQAAFLVAAASFAVVGAAPANAAACPGGSTNFQTLPFPPTFTCDQGGFQFTLNTPTGFLPLDSISFGNPSNGDAFTFTVNSNLDWAPGTYDLNYTITAPASRLLSTFSNNSTSSDTTAADTWTVVSQTAPQQTSVSTMTTGNGVNGTGTLTPNLTTESFAARLIVTNGGVQSVNFRVNTRSAAVPGPLPILGAVATFGFSRNIRKRIKAAV
jgi:hypothetical protein